MKKWLLPILGIAGLGALYVYSQDGEGDDDTPDGHVRKGDIGPGVEVVKRPIMVMLYSGSDLGVLKKRQDFKEIASTYPTVLFYTISLEAAQAYIKGYGALGIVDLEAAVNNWGPMETAAVFGYAADVDFGSVSASDENWAEDTREMALALAKYVPET